jgi:hypothetical protein
MKFEYANRSCIIGLNLYFSLLLRAKNATDDKNETIEIESTNNPTVPAMKTTVELVILKFLE